MLEYKGRNHEAFVNVSGWRSNPIERCRSQRLSSQDDHEVAGP
jgi:hypothetical protein